MTLLGDLFLLKHLSVCDDGASATLSLVASHPVYQAHFPGCPITPGVLMVQAVTEVAQQAWRQPLQIRSLKRVKYLAQLVPSDNKQVSLAIQRQVSDGVVCLSAVLSDATVTYAKMTLHCVADTPRVVAVIPAYNHAATLPDVLQRTWKVCADVLVVDDGSSDDTLARLDKCRPTDAAHRLTVLSYPRNKGKGHALKKGFAKALSMGFDYAVTIDADGQHYPEDIPLLLSHIEGSPAAVVVGTRNLSAEGMPHKNTFANRFSNFWFHLQTGVALPDTQSGFRLYPLRSLPGMCCIGGRYEAELALLVLSAWKGVPLVAQPVRVYYPGEGERVSHFRPFADFIRISLLNVVLTLAAPVARMRMAI